MGNYGMYNSSGNWQMMSMSDWDKYRMRWVYYNLDEREMKRLHAMGLDDTTIRAAANIALRSGLSMDYVLRRITVTGLPLNQVATGYGLNASVISEDIPGMGMASPMMMPGGTMGGTGSTGSMGTMGGSGTMGGNGSMGSGTNMGGSGTVDGSGTSGSGTGTGTSGTGTGTNNP